MKNLRNVVKRRVHLERHQPLARQKLGLLEKKKDYVLRAKDYHKKRDHVAHLQEKVRQRNPDEFAYGMLRGKIDDATGKFKTLHSKAALVGHGRTGADKLSAKKASGPAGKKLSKEQAQKNREFDHLSKDEQRTAETADREYVEWRLRLDKKKTEKRDGEMHFIGYKDANQKHVVFEGDNEEDHSDDVDEKALASEKETHRLDVGQPSNKASVSSASSSLSGKKSRSALRKEQRRAQILTAARHADLVKAEQENERTQKLQSVLSAMQNRRDAQAKGKKTAITDKKGKVIHYRFAKRRAK
ncbi:unnamed protein product [Amoebophrya sp. A25]|nr:unnamed protein product [Amoebophrya sp. A25]|eukprot:GSA25T00011701001.1